MIIDGRALAVRVLARAKERAAALPHPPRVVAYVTANPSAATQSYLKIKKRSAEAASCVFEESSTSDFFVEADAALVVQMPTDAAGGALVERIPVGKDADVLSTAAREAFYAGSINYSIYSSIYHGIYSGPLVPPVAAAVADILMAANVNPSQKRALVVGNGFLVGQPCAALLAQFGADVTVVDVDTPKDVFAAALLAADIIVSGAGVPHLITPDAIQEGVVLIDAGTAESGGKIVGDADPACAPKCSVFTPVPGGVGPLAVAKLFENAVLLAERKVANG